MTTTTTNRTLTDTRKDELYQDMAVLLLSMHRRLAVLYHYFYVAFFGCVVVGFLKSLHIVASAMREIKKERRQTDGIR